MRYIDGMDGMPLFYEGGDNPVQPGQFFFAGGQTAAGIRNYLMRSQVGLFRVIEGFEQGTLGDGRTGVAHIRRVGSDGADFFYKFFAVFIAMAELAPSTGCNFTVALCSAKGRGDNPTRMPVFTGIKRIGLFGAAFSQSNIDGVFTDFPGDGGRILMQVGSDFFKGQTFLKKFL